MTDIYSMKETAIGIHEMFKSLCEAGFTRKEALQIVISLTKGDKNER